MNNAENGSDNLANSDSINSNSNNDSNNNGFVDGHDLDIINTSAVIVDLQNDPTYREIQEPVSSNLPNAAAAASSSSSPVHESIALDNLPARTSDASADTHEEERTESDIIPGSLHPMNALDSHFSQYGMGAAQQMFQSFHLHESDHHHDPPRSTTTHHDEHVPPMPPPPRQSEPTAREQLIERERQARLERDRARLKRQLALSRERDEEDQAFQDAEIVRIHSDDSIANTSIRALELDINIESNDHNHEIESIHDEEQNGLMDGLTLETNGNGHGHGQPDHDGVDVDGDGKSLACMIGDGGDDDNANDCNRGILPNGNVSGEIEEKPVLPLGFTMERFLQDGIVVHDHTPPNDLQQLNLTGNDANDHNNPSDNGADADQETASIHIMDARTNTSELSSPVRIGSVDVEVDVDVNAISQRDGNTNMGDRRVSHELIPRLAQLTEAEILEMAEIDYASVGNMPPRSVRDERHLPDLSGMSNASFDHTHTTMQESDASAGLSLQTRSSICSIEGEHHHEDITQVSPLLNATRLPVNSFTSSTINTGVFENEIDASCQVLGSDTSDRKPAAIVGPIISHLKGDDDDKWPNDGHHTTGSFVNLAVFDNINSKQGTGSITSIPVESDDSDVDVTTSRTINNVPNVLESLHRGSIDGATNDEYTHNIAALGNDLDSSFESFNLPNRIIRPGMVKINGESKTSKGHRRAKTTPNMPSFVDDFDYCKYNDVESTSNTNQLFGSARWGLDTNSIPQGLSDTDSKKKCVAYGTIDPEEGQPLISTKVRSGEESHFEERGFDNMVNSVFSSVRSMSTADFQAEINDCDKYSSSSVLSRGK